MELATLILAIVAAVSGIGGTVGSLISNKKAREAQQEHDREMALLGQTITQENFDYQNQFDTIGNTKGQMVKNGYNPALLYGSMSPVQYSASSGGASANNVGFPTDFSKFSKAVDPYAIMENELAQKNSEVMREKMKAESDYTKQRQLESLARTVEQQRDTRVKNNLEKTIVDTATQNLLNLKTEARNMESEITARDALTASQIELNAQKCKESEAYVNKMNREAEKIGIEITREPLVRMQISADISRIKAATGNYYADTARLQESIKEGQLGRIMQEFGLNAQTLPPNLRNNKAYKTLWTTQMSAATSALMKAGFSEFEAINAVIYYTASDPKDVTPSVVNGFSRVFSSMVKVPTQVYNIGK